MANPTARVPTMTTPVIEEKFSWGLTNVAQTYYSNEMLGLNTADGYATKYDDTAVMRFLGVLFDGVPSQTTVDADDAAGAKVVQIHRPKYVEFLCTDTLATADVGKPVWSKFSNEVSYQPGVNKNFVGKVAKYIDSTHLLVRPEYDMGPAIIAVSLPWNVPPANIRNWTADKPYTVYAITASVEVAGTDAGGVTAVVKKAASGTAMSAGTALHSGTINLKGTAATNQAITTTTVVATQQLATGDSLGITFTGVTTAAIGHATVFLVPHGF